MYNLKLNPETGSFEGQFQAKVVSLGEVSQKNVNGTEYAVGSIEFPDTHGQLVTRSAICYKKNFDKGITVGQTYLCNVTVTSDRPAEPILSISSLTGAVRASADDFGFDFAEASVKADVGAEQVA